MARIAIDSKDFVTIPEMAKRMGKPKMTLYRWVKAGKLISVEFGGIKFIPVSELKRLEQPVSDSV